MFISPGVLPPGRGALISQCERLVAEQGYFCGGLCPSRPPHQSRPVILTPSPYPAESSLQGRAARPLPSCTVWACRASSGRLRWPFKGHLSLPLPTTPVSWRPAVWHPHATLQSAGSHSSPLLRGGYKSLDGGCCACPGAGSVLLPVPRLGPGPSLATVGTWSWRGHTYWLGEGLRR